MNREVKRLLSGLLLAVIASAPISAAHGLTLFSFRGGPGYTGFLQQRTVGETRSIHRWRCAVTVGAYRLNSTGFTETAARAKLLPYTNSHFRCERRRRIGNR